MENQAASASSWWSELRAFGKRIRWGDVGSTFAATWLWVTVLLAVVGLIAKLTESLGILPDTATVEVTAYWYYRLVDRAWSREVTDGSFWEHMFLVVIAAPLIEEAIFRWLVCSIGERLENLRLKWPVIIVFSFLIFGLLHPNRVYSIALQGVSGLLFARLYLKYKGEDQLAAYASCVAVHAAYNFSVNVWEVIQKWAS